ncbi:MAG: prepilin-type N-terminal cleavage/methylation domain-containing protein [Hormoscilla sp.]
MNNLLRTLWQKRCDRGMTLVELLVVIVILGILSSIALPASQKAVCKAREAEATINIGNSSRSQQAYYTEKGNFSLNFAKLNFAIESVEEEYDSEVAALAAFASSSDIEVSSKESKNYLYVIIAMDDDDEPMAIHVAASKIDCVRSYAGVVYLKEGNMQICIPEPIEANLQDMTSVIEELGNVISNPEESCPGIVE